MDNVTFESQREEAIAQVRQSVQTLLVLLIENFLIDEYKNRTRDLDAEDSGLENEWQILSESHANLEPISAAKVRVAQRGADDALAQGDTNIALIKHEEARDIQQNFDGIADRIQQVDARRADIVNAKRGIAREIFEQVYMSLPAASFAVIEDAVNLLDGFKAGMFEYQRLTGLEPTSFRDRGLVQRSHIERLTPNSLVGRQLAGRVAQWFR